MLTYIISYQIMKLDSLEVFFSLCKVSKVDQYSQELETLKTYVCVISVFLNVFAILCILLSQAVSKYIFMSPSSVYKSNSSLVKAVRSTGSRDLTWRNTSSLARFYNMPALLHSMYECFSMLSSHKKQLCIENANAEYNSGQISSCVFVCPLLSSTY